MSPVLSDLRKKNNKDKRAFAMVTATLATGLIFVVWLVSVVTTFDGEFEFDTTEFRESFPTEEFSERTSDIVNDIDTLNREIELQEQQELLFQQQLDTNPTPSNSVPFNIIWTTTTEETQ